MSSAESTKNAGASLRRRWLTHKIFRCSRQEAYAPAECSSRRTAAVSFSYSKGDHGLNARQVAYKATSNRDGREATVWTQARKNDTLMRLEAAKESLIHDRLA